MSGPIMNIKGDNALSADQLAAVTGATSPSAENVFATMADLPGPVDGPDIRILADTLIGVTETTIAHGLSGTPMSVFVLPVGPQFVWESSPADATNIYLTASAPCTPVVAVLNGTAIVPPANIVNFGSEAVDITETVISHGQSWTPTFVFITPVGPQFVWQSTPPDATNIYLTASAPCSPIIAIKE